MTKHKAFTLIEIMTVVIIISILATLSIPPFVKTIEVSKGRLAKTNLKLIYSAEKVYRNEYDTYYPDTPRTANLTEINENLGLDLSTVDNPPPSFIYTVTTTTPKEGFTATAASTSKRYPNWIITINQKEELSDPTPP
ncbi:MAG: type II secretion system protein [Candidatus Omnitrophica bacterium]|nr:type II secretion system protein [Candidatus Omnitrophota bacterium]